MNTTTRDTGQEIKVSRAAIAAAPHRVIVTKQYLPLNIFSLDGIMLRKIDMLGEFYVFCNIFHRTQTLDFWKTNPQIRANLGQLCQMLEEFPKLSPLVLIVVDATGIGVVFPNKEYIEHVKAEAALQKVTALLETWPN